MRGHLVTHVFFHTQRNVRIDHVVVHHAAMLEEVAILVEAVERFTQRTRNRRDLGKVCALAKLLGQALVVVLAKAGPSVPVGLGLGA